MKVIITETQYKKLQRYLKKNQLNEASIGRNIGMAALGGALSLGSAKGQEVEPTGKFTFPTDYGGKRDKVTIDSNIVNITSPTQIADILQMVFTQYDSLEIPINRKNIDETNFILQNVIIDSSYGGKNLDGYYFVPKGRRSEEEIFNAPFATKIWRYLKGVFGENVRLPIKKVRMDNSVVVRFIKLVESEETPFNIKRDRNGKEVIYKEYDYN
jgi:hypothetical protein